MILKPTTYNLQANQGFTLIELIIYLAIVSALATSLILWSLTVHDLGARARWGTAINASGRFALETITRDIEQAASITNPALPGPSSTLVLTNDLGETVTVNVSNGQLTRTVGSGDPLRLTASPVEVTNFTVALATYPMAIRNSLSVTLTLRTSSVPGRTFTTSANLRRQ